MLSPFRQVTRTNVDDGAADTFGRSDDDVVVFRHLESVERFGLPLCSRRLIQDTLIYGLGNGVVYELAKDETV